MVKMRALPGLPHLLPDKNMYTLPHYAYRRQVLLALDFMLSWMIVIVVSGCGTTFNYNGNLVSVAVSII